MNKKNWAILTGLCWLLVFAVCVMPSGAQTNEVKPKPTMYSYIANWQIPRANWKEMAADMRDDAVMEKALADGTIVGYGRDENLIHSPEGETHDDWWSSMSMAGLVKVLDRLQAAGTATSPALESATKHWDLIFRSRYYNWKPGAYKGSYVAVSSYKLKGNASDNALDLLSGRIVAPLLEKMLADGNISQYEIDTMAVHTRAPGTFSIVYVCPSADDLDKVEAAIRASIKAEPIEGLAFDAVTDDSAHRDELLRGSGTFK